MEEKTFRTSKEGFTASEQASPNHVPVTETEWGESHHDAADMARLGKKQEFKVNEKSVAKTRYLC